MFFIKTLNGNNNVKNSNKNLFWFFCFFLFILPSTVRIDCQSFFWQSTVFVLNKRKEDTSPVCFLINTNKNYCFYFVFIVRWRVQGNRHPIALLFILGCCNQHGLLKINCYQSFDNIFWIDDKRVIACDSCNMDIFFSFLDFPIFFSPEGSKNITEKSRNSKYISHIALLPMR